MREDPDLYLSIFISILYTIADSGRARKFIEAGQNFIAK